MVTSLIHHERIKTTVPKAKELKPQIDKVITLGKKNNLQSKKNLFSELQSKTSVDKLIKILSQRYERQKNFFMLKIIINSTWLRIQAVIVVWVERALSVAQIDQLRTL